MINILDARVCQHCGCVYIPAADYKGACPISTEHTVYISVSLMLAEEPKNWPGKVTVDKLGNYLLNSLGGME